MSRPTALRTLRSYVILSFWHNAGRPQLLFGLMCGRGRDALRWEQDQGCVDQVNADSRLAAQVIGQPRRRISCVRQTMRSSLTFALTLCLLVAPAMVIAQPQMPHYPAEYSYNMTATIGIVSATINSWNGESDYRIFPRPSYSAFQMISMVGCALIPSSRARGRRSFNSSQKAK